MSNRDVNQEKGPELSGDLLSAAQVLWGRSGKLRVSLGRESSAGFRRLERFGLLPNAKRPRLLVPLGSSRAASASVRQFIVPMNLRARVVRALVSAGMRVGVAQQLARDRLHVSIREQDLRGDLSEVLLTEHLREVFERADLEIAVKLDKVRPNWKPVLQLLTPDGRVGGYAKIGWNELTRGLVRNEAEVLERYASASPATFRSPRVLHSGGWGDLDLIVVSPMPQPPWSLRRMPVDPPMPATTEVATLFGVHRRPLAESAYWSGIRQRVAEAQSGAAGPPLDRLNDIARRLEQQQGAREVPFASWHGDWAPWNMARLGNTLFVWDWERSARDVPLGFDVVHYQFQARMRLLRRSVRQAVEDCLVRSVPFLGSMGMDAALEGPVVTLYLLEIFLRYHESRAAGVRAADRVYVDLLGVLSERVGASRR